MTKKDKKVPASQNRGDSKEVRATQNDYSNENPSWRFSTVDKSGDFAWPVNSQEELHIVQKLHDFDSMLWSEIKGKQHHTITLDKLSKEAQNRLNAINQDDIDEIFSFRLNGKTRVFCIIDRHIAKLLWYDPEHKVCISNLRHT